MFRRAVSAVLIPVMVVQLSGCTKTVWIGPEEMRPADENIRGVKTVEGEKVDFDWRPRPTVEGDTIYAHVKDESYLIAFNQIESVGVRRTDVVASILVTALTVGIVVGIAGYIAFSEAMEDFGWGN